MRSRREIELVNISKNKSYQFEFKIVCEWKLRERGVNQLGLNKKEKDRKECRMGSKYRGSAAR